TQATHLHKRYSVSSDFGLRIADWRLRIADLELNDSFDYDNPQSEIRNPKSPIRNRFQSTCRLMRGADSLRLAAVAMIVTSGTRPTGACSEARKVNRATRP